MSVDIDTSPAALSESPTESRTYRLAGWGALLAAVSYILQPVIVFTFYPPVASEDVASTYSDVADLAGRTWSGSLEAAVFAGVAFGLLLVTTAVGRLLRAGRPSAGLWIQITTAFGWFSAAGWLLMAGLSIANYSSVTLFLPETGADQTVQRAVIQGTYIAITGGLAFASLAFLGWLVGFSILGRRSGVVGWPLTVVALLAAAVLVLSLFAWTSPIGMLALIPFLLVFGVAFLLTSRRGRTTV